MARKISAHTTVGAGTSLGSTSDLIGNQGSTTIRFNVGQLLGALAVNAGDMTYAKAARNSTLLARPTSGAIMAFSTGASTDLAAPAWVILDPGAMVYASSLGIISSLAAPSSGALMYYSTINGQIGPRWSVVNAGTLIYGPGTTLAIGTYGYILQSTGGVPSWEGITAGAILIGNTSGQPVELAAGSSGEFLGLTTGVPDWKALPTSGLITTAGTSGQLFQTPGGAAAWRNTTAVYAETLTGSGDLLTRTSSGVERLP